MNSYKKLLLTVSMVVSLSANAVTVPKLVKVPDEPNVNFWIVYHDQEGNLHTVITQSVTPSSKVQYFLEIYNCDNKTYRWVASAPTWEKLQQRKPVNTSFVPWNGIVTKAYGAVICEN